MQKSVMGFWIVSVLLVCSQIKIRTLFPVKLIRGSTMRNAPQPSGTREQLIFTNTGVRRLLV